jgi:hypothetical protein
MFSLDLIESIAIIISALAATVAALFIARQIVLMKRSREVETFLQLIREAKSDKISESSTWIKNNLKDNPSYESLRSGPDSWAHMKNLNHFFEMVGILVIRKQISEDLVFDQMGSWVVEMWELQESAIRKRRAERNDNAYCENYEILARRYIEWAKKNPPKLIGKRSGV